MVLAVSIFFGLFAITNVPNYTYSVIFPRTVVFDMDPRRNASVYYKYTEMVNVPYTWTIDNSYNVL